MAKSNVEAIIASIKNAGMKTAAALKTILSEQSQTPEVGKDGKLTARERITSILDAGTFSEIGTYMFRRGTEYDTEEGLESVICGWGSIDGQLVYCFSQDFSRSKGAVSENHAKKVCEIYRLAMENGAPVIGIFDSAGAVIPEGVKALAGYGAMMNAVANASGVIPQIAIVPGACAGSAAVIAGMFDFLIITKETGSISVNSPFVMNSKEAGTAAFASETGLAAAVAENDYAASLFARRLISFLPSNSSVGLIASEICTDNLNRKLGNLNFGGEALAVVSVIADNSMFLELTHDYAPGATTAFATIGGVKCGVVATSFAQNEGRIDTAAALSGLRALQRHLLQNHNAV